MKNQTHPEATKADKATKRPLQRLLLAANTHDDPAITEVICEANVEFDALNAIKKDAERARIALTFYRQWIGRLTNNKSSYPSGCDVERDLAQSLATLAKLEGGK